MKKTLAAVALGVVAGALGMLWLERAMPTVHAAPSLSALDYQEIQQLLYRYAHGIDTCGNNGMDYANVFTDDGVFIDRNSDAGFAAGGRVLARGRKALAELIGGGAKGCQTKLIWTDWSHLMMNPVLTATRTGASGRIYLVQMGMTGPGTIARHGGYEDVYVKTLEGWRIKSRTHVRDKAWHAPALQTADLN
jgi:hypothetical protein